MADKKLLPIFYYEQFDNKTLAAYRIFKKKKQFDKKNKPRLPRKIKKYENTIIIT